MRKCYFGTDGVRGVFGGDVFNPIFLTKLGFALGHVARSHHSQPKILIGRDTRISSELIESSLQAGLCYAGIDVFVMGVASTPEIAFITKVRNFDYGVVISASHNPYCDNGIKIFNSSGTKISIQIEQEIEQHLETMYMHRKLGAVVKIQDNSYVDFCVNAFNTLDLHGLNIVLDCANGATYKHAPLIFAQLGANVVTANITPNGYNINDQCGSQYPDSIKQLLLSSKSDYGVIFDGDGDRVVIMDHHGKSYNGDQLLYVILRGYLAQNIKIDGVVGTVMSNLALEHELNKQGIQFIRTKVGDKYISEKLLEYGWLLGGEASGHILCMDKHSTGDGVISTLQTLYALRKLNMSLSQTLTWQQYPQVILNINIGAILNWQEISHNTIQEALHSMQSNGRVVVRTSGTESSILRIMVEHEVLDTANYWAHKIAALFVKDS